MNIWTPRRHSKISKKVYFYFFVNPEWRGHWAEESYVSEKESFQRVWLYT